MTPSMHEPPPPALHRRLPNPAIDHTTGLHRNSSLSQHHLFHDQLPDHARDEHGARRHTVQLPQNSNLEPNNRGEPTLRSMLSPGYASRMRSERSASGEMVEEPTQQNSNHSISYSREHVCLCPPDPKIPRPRNCMLSSSCSSPSLFRSCSDRMRLIHSCSIHSFPSAPTRQHYCPESRHSESGGLKDYWRTMAEAVHRSQGGVEYARGSMSKTAPAISIKSFVHQSKSHLGRESPPSRTISRLSLPPSKKRKSQQSSIRLWSFICRATRALSEVRWEADTELFNIQRASILQQSATKHGLTNSCEAWLHREWPAWSASPRTAASRTPCSAKVICGSLSLCKS